MNMTKAMELNLRRKELPWDDEIWNRIDRVLAENRKRIYRIYTFSKSSLVFPDCFLN